MFSLVCHPQTPSQAVRSVGVNWSLLPDGRLVLRWQVDGAEALVVPGLADLAGLVGKGRADGLWHTTCFEMFLKGAGSAYREFNFSPSRRWAAYHFASYREAMSEQPMAEPPEIAQAMAGDSFTCTVMLPGALLGDALHVGLSAVIEERHGHKSYWALAHAPGDPDFHAASCFTIAIGAAEAP